MNITQSKIKTIIIAISALTMYVLSLCCTPIKAQGIAFKKDNWQSIKNKAKAENKLIFVDVYTTWCGPCKKMDKQVFSSEKVGNFYNANYVAFKIDAEKGEGLAFAKQYEIASYPSLLILDGNGKQINKNKGFLNIEDFLKFGQETLSAEEVFVAAQSLYNKGSRDPKLVLNYITLLRGRNLPTEKVALEYFNTIEKKNWTSPENLQFITQYINSPFNDVTEHLAENKEPIESVGPQSKVYLTLFEIYNNHINTTVAKNKSLKEEDPLLLLHINNHFYPIEAKFLIFKVKRTLFARDKDWESYARLITDYVDNLDNSNALELNKYAYLFYKNITDKHFLNVALGWINTALERTNDNDPYISYYLDTKASVLYKLNNKKEALVCAKQAVAAAEKSGSNTAGTLNLIKKIENLK